MEQKLLSIYIGNDVTRICEVVKKSSTSIIVNNATEVATPAGAIDDGYITDVNAIAESIRGCVFGRGFSASKAIFTVSSKKIANKEIVIPYVKGDKKITKILQANSGEYFPMSTTGEFIFAHSIMENFQDSEGKKIRITAIAAPKDLIEGYYEIAEELKLSVESIDYVGNSVLQLLSLQMRDDSTELVLQIEKDVTFVNIMSGKDIILQRSVPYGKNAVINSMMEVKKLTEKEAKALLSNRKAIEEQVTEEEYAEVVRYLISSIGRIVEYHRSRNPERIIDGIKVFGEGSSIEGIDEILQQELGAEVTHFTQLVGVKVSGKAYLTSETALRYLANFGAVLNPIGLNITATADKDKTSQSINIILFVLLGLSFIVMLSLCGIWIGRYYMEKSARDKLQRDIDAMEHYEYKGQSVGVEAVAEYYENAVSSYLIVKEYSDGTYSNNEVLLRLVQDMEAVFPKGTEITKMDSTDGIVTLELIVPSKQALADMQVKISNLDYVSYVDIPSIKENIKKNVDAKGKPIVAADGEEAPEEIRTITGKMTIILVNEQRTEVDEKIENALSLSSGVPADAASANTGVTVEEGGAE